MSKSAGIVGRRDATQVANNSQLEEERVPAGSEPDRGSRLGFDGRETAMPDLSLLKTRPCGLVVEDQKQTMPDANACPSIHD